MNSEILLRKVLQATAVLHIFTREKNYCTGCGGHVPPMDPPPDESMLSKGITFKEKTA